MKRTIIALAALALFIDAANAACSTASLAGTWTVAASSWCTAKVTSSGNVTGTCGSGKISLTSTCKLSGTMAGAKVVGRADSNGNIFVLKMGTYLVTGYKN